MLVKEEEERKKDKPDKHTHTLMMAMTVWTLGRRYHAFEFRLLFDLRCDNCDMMCFVLRQAP